MSRPVINDSINGSPTLGNLLTARPSGLTEPECWAILCQAVQALQDLFLSDGASGESCTPLVTPSTLVLSSRGRVKLCQSAVPYGMVPPVHLAGYLAPEYRPGKQSTDNEAEKMWIYGLGETLKRATLTSHAATLRLSSDLCCILAEMTKVQVSGRASLMNLLDVVSRYCKRRQQNRPFSHIVMDLHQEAMAAIEMTLDTPWGPPAMPELRPRTRNRCESSAIDGIGTIPRRWINLTRNHDQPPPNFPKLTKEASTSMEDLSLSTAIISNIPGTVRRPKSMCVPDPRHFGGNKDIGERDRVISASTNFLGPRGEKQRRVVRGGSNNNDNSNRGVRRNAVQRAASRLYRASDKMSDKSVGRSDSRDCVGPEFVVRASLPNKYIAMVDYKGNHVATANKRAVTVILLNGQKVDVLCNPNYTTAGMLFETIIQKEHIEENFMLGLSALIAGDFVFLPSDTRICKAVQGNSSPNCPITLFMRVRFFLPSLRGIRSPQTRHLLYLQLRRSILEHQLPSSFSQLIELDGFALQAEFGDYNDRVHGAQDYFLMEHYVPETMSCALDDHAGLKQELIHSHMSKAGLSVDKAEEDFIAVAQNLPHYGGHFYTATWMLKDNNHKDVWLYISAQGINLFERGRSTSNSGPQLYEMFEWRSIQTLCYSKHYLCILPHSVSLHASKLKKYKLKMDHKKSYFTFRLASLHHQFFLRLRTEYTSLQTLSQQFGIALKDMKNESNSLCKMQTFTNPMSLDQATVNAETEFKIEFRASSKCSRTDNKTTTTPPSSPSAASHVDAAGETRTICRRARSVHDIANMNADENNVARRDFHKNVANNKENGLCDSGKRRRDSCLVLDSCYLAGCLGTVADKRRGVKMGTKVFNKFGPRATRSMEAVNGTGDNDFLEEMSLQSVSLHCSSDNSISSPATEGPCGEAYILDASIQSVSTHFLPDFHETLSDTLLEKLNNISFAEERILSNVHIERDHRGSLGMQITEGSDGNVYVQSVITGGPAHMTGNVMAGDQVIAVDSQSLLGMKYNNALNLLTNTGDRVEFVLSRSSLAPSRSRFGSQCTTLRAGDVESLRGRIDLSNINQSHLKTVRLENTMNRLKRLSYPYSIYASDSPVEKHVTENCCDSSNVHKRHGTTSEVPYHKHIRYEIESERESLMSEKQLPTSTHSTPLSLHNSFAHSRNFSKSCSQIGSSTDKAVVVNFIPKKSCDLSDKIKATIPPIALPRCLGLSRKWRGPVRYPVTPVKKTLCSEVDQFSNYLSTSDEEQVFI